MLRGSLRLASFSIELMTVPELTLGMTAPLTAVAVFML